MGNTTAPNGIRNFTPDNTSDTLYIEAGVYMTLTLGDILDKVRAHFGDDINFDDLTINAEHIHTRCLGYDLYDPSDYDEFIVITKNQ